MDNNNNISVPTGYWISEKTGGLCHLNNGIIHDTKQWFPVGHAPLDGVKKSIVNAVLATKNYLVELFKIESHHLPENHPKHSNEHLKAQPPITIKA